MAPQAFLEFLACDDGAVTVDWVVLTAAIVGLSMGVFTVITRDSVSVGGQVISDKLSESATMDFEALLTPAD